MQNLHCDAFTDPFPHIVLHDFYDDEELKLIWEELDFYTKPGKLVSADKYGGIVGKTDSKALMLDDVYPKAYRNLSNILEVNRKVFTSGVLDVLAQCHGCCSIAPLVNKDNTKVRYYHDGEGYEPHKDKSVQFLAFSYFYKEPKKFEGGELYFPDYIDIDALTCENNMTIIFPGWVQHGVRTVTIKDSDYYDGFGRYAITSFMSCIDNEKRNFQGLNKKD
mgnify:FL=1|tara:strand:+ start:1966 stop:2625 length:660 start_codon:yes stop_codon:yes gene_type:complete